MGQVASSAPPLSSSALRQAILKRFAASKISKDAFTVEVRGRVAVLKGKTDVAQHKGVATRLAKAVGARVVDNRIRLTERARQRYKHTHRSAPRRVHVQRR